LPPQLWRGCPVGCPKMGATTCKCNLGDSEEDTLRLSRDPKQGSGYAFPQFPQPGDGTDKDFVGVSALATPQASSSHVPPLDARGANADAAGGQAVASCAGKLETVAEDSRENPKSEQREERLAELKEALLDAVDANGQLPSHLSDTAKATRGTADAAAGQPLVGDPCEVPSEHDGGPLKNRMPPTGQLQILPPGEAEKASMVYFGSAIDAAAAQAQAHQFGLEPQRRHADVNGDGVVLDMTLPAAVDLALAAERDARGPQTLQRHELEQGQQPERVAVTPLHGDVESAANRLGCFQMAESSSCSGCPLGGNPSLELSREGFKKSEHYETHDQSATTAFMLSALAVPPEIAQQADGGVAEIRQADVKSEVMLSLREAALLEELELPPRPGLQALAVDGDLRRAADGAPDFIDAMGSGTDGTHRSDNGLIEGEPDVKQISLPDDGEGLDGEWINCGTINIICGSKIIFASGEACELEPSSHTNCHMVLDGTVYYGRLSPCRQKLLWSDGDIWVRRSKEEQPAPETDIAPPALAVAEAGAEKAAKKEDPEASAEKTPEKVELSKATEKADASKAAEGKLDAAKKTEVTQGAHKKDVDKKDAGKKGAVKKGAENKGAPQNAKPPANACCDIQ